MRIARVRWLAIEAVIMNRRKLIKIVVGVVVISSAAGYLLYSAAESSYVYYYSVDEFAAERDSGAGANRMVRLAGRVKAGSTARDAGKGELEFVLAGEDKSLAVKYNGIVPRNFEDDKEVIVEGRIGAGGVFEARLIITRCESKYQAKLQETDNE